MSLYFLIRFDGIPYEISLDSGDQGVTGLLSIKKADFAKSGQAVVFERGNFTALGPSKDDSSFACALKRIVLSPDIGKNLDAETLNRLAGIARQIREEIDSSQEGAQAMAAALTLQFMTIIGRAAPALPKIDIWSIADAIAHIEENYVDAFTLEFFVSKCALNVNDFSRRFKEKAGCPLFEFIHRQRIKHACAVLKSSDMPIIDVSFAVGYNNLSFFNRYFLRIMGVSPRAFRQAST